MGSLQELRVQEARFAAQQMEEARLERVLSRKER